MMAIDFGQIARVLGIEDQNQAKNPIASREMAKEWLASPRKFIDQENDIVGRSEASWLLIFDNVDDPGILEPYWPIFGSGSILLTSRDRDASKLFVGQTLTLNLKPFDDPDGALLFRKLAYRPQKDGDEGITKVISKELGGLPLAIAQMAGVVQYHKLTFQEFYEQYQLWKERSQLFQEDMSERLSLRRGSITTIFATEKLSAPARALLNVCVILDPDRIQESLFTDHALSIGICEDFPRTKLSYQVARGELQRCSLIKRNEDDKYFSLHRVIQDAVRIILNQQEMANLLEKVTVVLASAWGHTAIDKVHMNSGWKIKEELFAHILSLKRYFDQYGRFPGFVPDFTFAKLLHEGGW